MTQLGTGLVLALLFLVEVLAVAAAAVWGAWRGGLLLALAAATLVVVAWGLFASPKAPYGGHGARPVVKVLVFAGATAGLWVAGHHGWAVGFAVLTMLVHAAARPVLAEPRPGPPTGVEGS